MIKKKFSTERQQQIIDYLDAYKIASVEELATYLKVTETTIRRDLILLDEQKKVKRTHGGVLKVTKQLNWNKTPLSDRFDCNNKAKERIARYAAENLVKDNESLMIDGGSTTIMCAQAIKDKHNNLIIISNTQDIAKILGANSTNQVILTGGEYIPQTQVQVGFYAENILNKFRVDVSIISCSGLLLDEGLFSSNPHEAEIKRLMVQNATTSVLLCDSTKFNQQAFSFIVSLLDIDVIVTDKDASEEDLNKLKEYNINIITV